MQLYLEHHTQYGKYCSLKLETWAVGITVGSGDVPGRKGLRRRRPRRRRRRYATPTAHNSVRYIRHTTEYSAVLHATAQYIK